MKVQTICIALLSIFLNACGGGSGTESIAGIDGRGSPVAIFSKGTITGFGSVIVNGVRYDTNAASFDIDGVSGTQDDLSVGDVVIVQGTIADDGVNGTASSVTFGDLVEGPISAIDSVAGTLVVLGQLVHIDADTSFDDNISPASIDGLAVNDVVEVSGLVRADGSISATRIEAKPAGGEFEVTGFVSSLSGTIFQINNLVVDFSSAQLDNFPGGTPENGQIVEAKGTVISANGELIATRVEFKGNDFNPANGAQVEIEGFITRFVSPQDFDVAGISVTTTTATTFIGGVAGDLGLNIKVEVEGTVNANGVLVASEVDIRRTNKVRATALVDSVNAAGNSLVVIGITVNVDAATRLEDKSNADVRPFTLADINAGDYIEVRGDEFPAGSGQILAARLERDDVDNETILQGFVEAMSDPSYTVLGVSIQTDAGTVFRDVNDNVITAAEFFQQLSVNDLVKASGTEVSATSILATEVEFENAT